MQEEDYEILRNEANATPRRYSEWDQQGQMRREYAALHDNDPRFLNAQPATPETAHTQNAQKIEEEHEAVAAKEEVAAPLTRQSSASSSSTTSSNSTHSARLEEIRTAHSTPARDRRPTINSQASSGNLLQLHPTERNPEAIRRIETHRSQHRSTVGTEDVPSRLTRTITRRKTEKPLPSLGAGKPFPPLLPDREEYVVEFDGVDDPLHAQNWPTKKKLGIAAILAFDALAATMGSSIFSSATRVIAVKYHVAPVVATLGTSLFVFGYAFGPLVFPQQLHEKKMRLTSTDVGPILRALRAKAAPHHRRLWFCHLQHCSRRCQRPPDHSHLSLLRRPVRLLTSRNRRRCVRRHV